MCDIRKESVLGMVSTCGVVQHIGHTRLFSEGFINLLDVKITRSLDMETRGRGWYGDSLERSRKDRQRQR
jgi:hypothetical protein